MATEPKDDTGGLLDKLREPFPPNQISKLPKESRAQIDERKTNRNSAINCTVCGGWHHKNAVHLDYVGHAALTDRLLDTDISWSWEPVAFNDKGLPAFDQNGGLWIKLTVQGVTRLGYGSADGKSGGDAVKEIIGDALRNAAMRFGAALDLWHKGDLHTDQDNSSDDSGLNADRITETQEGDLIALADEVGADIPKFAQYLKVSRIADLPAERYQEAVRALEAKRVKKAA